MNLVAFQGRLGADAELKKTTVGKVVCSFSLAVKDGRENTIWISCSVWGSRAEKLAPYLLKGQGIAVSGSLRNPDIWTNRESGEPRGKNAIFVDRVTFTGGVEDAGTHTRAQDAPRKPEPVATHTDTPETDEIPF